MTSLIKWNFMTFPNVSCDTARLHKADATQDFAHSIRCTRYAFCLLRNSRRRICCCTCAKPSSQIIDKASNYTQFREDARCTLYKIWLCKFSVSVVSPVEISTYFWSERHCIACCLDVLFVNDFIQLKIHTNRK